MPKQLLDVTALVTDQAKQGMPEHALRVADGFYERSGQGIAEIVAEVQKGNTVHFYSEGAWSLHQLVEELLKLSGKCELYLSSFAICEDAIRMLSNAKDAGTIKSLHCIIDNRTESRTARPMQLLQSIADDCVLLPCHAKVTVLMGHNADITIMGSANYSENKRIEVGIVMPSQSAAHFHARWIKDKIRQHGAKADR